MTAKQRPERQPQSNPTIAECELARTTIRSLIPFLSSEIQGHRATAKRINKMEGLLVEYIDHISGTPSKRFKAHYPE